MAEKIIFHLPLELNPDIKSASHIRPLKMLKAFEDLGYDVLIIMGCLKQRKESFSLLKHKVAQGEKYIGMYSESSTMPNALTESHHLPLDPTFEKRVFKFCQDNKIPIGLFYRDIHWNFSHYAKISPLKKALARFFYLYDLKVYNQFVSILYLPSLPMLKHIPQKFSPKIKVYDLPSGVDQMNVSEGNIDNKKLKIIYVGGTGELYQNQVLFKKMKRLEEGRVPVELHYCTRESEWMANKDSYEISENIFIHHISGNELENLMLKMDLGLIMVEGNEYWSFVMPMKAFEYLSYDLPILANRELYVGDYVHQNQIGMQLSLEDKSFEECIINLSKNRAELNSMKNMVQQNKKNHYWSERVKKVIHDFKTAPF